MSQDERKRVFNRLQDECGNLNKIHAVVGQYMSMFSPQTYKSYQGLMALSDYLVARRLATKPPSQYELMEVIEKIEVIRGAFAPIAEKEPILRKEQPEDTIYKRYREMRNITAKIDNGWYIYVDTTNQFYLQAQFMEGFTDTYDHPAELFRYSATYTDLSFRQWRWYFTWRTKIRAGIYEKVNLSYAYLYAYELLNRIGGRDTMDCLALLVDFWENYRKVDPAVNHYLKNWIRDYIIVYLEGETEQEQFPEAAKTLMQSQEEILCQAVENGCFKGLLPLLSQRSLYKISKSKFCQSEYGTMMEETLLLVIQTLQNWMGKARFKRKFLGRKKSQAWEPFQGAVVKKTEWPDGHSVIVSPYESYAYQQGKGWSQTALREYDREFVGNVVKTTEFYLRSLTGYPYKIKLSGMEPAIQSCIEEAVKTCVKEKGWTNVAAAPKRKQQQNICDLPQKKREEAPVPRLVKITINPTVLMQARQDADEITEKLLIEPVPEERLPEPIEEPTIEEGWDSLMEGLSQAARDTVSALLEGTDDLSPLALKTGIMPEVLIEEINSRALDCVGDTVIDASDYHIYEDYLDQLQAAWKMHGTA